MAFNSPSAYRRVDEPWLHEQLIVLQREMANLRRRLYRRGFRCVSVQYDYDADMIDVHFLDGDDVVDFALDRCNVWKEFRQMNTKRGAYCT